MSGQRARSISGEYYRYCKQEQVGKGSCDCRHQGESDLKAGAASKLLVKRYLSEQTLLSVDTSSISQL